MHFFCTCSHLVGGLVWYIRVYCIVYESTNSFFSMHCVCIGITDFPVGYLFSPFDIHSISSANNPTYFFSIFPYNIFTYNFWLIYVYNMYFLVVSLKYDNGKKHII